jgi:hypothetical protein
VSEATHTPAKTAAAHKHPARNTAARADTGKRGQNHENKSLGELLDSHSQQHSARAARKGEQLFSFSGGFGNTETARKPISASDRIVADRSARAFSFRSLLLALSPAPLRSRGGLRRSAPPRHNARGPDQFDKTFQRRGAVLLEAAVFLGADHHDSIRRKSASSTANVPAIRQRRRRIEGAAPRSTPVDVLTSDHRRTARNSTSRERHPPIRATFDRKLLRCPSEQSCSQLRFRKTANLA